MSDVENFNLIYSYTRTQAIEDGVLIDVTEEAKPYGFKVPVAVTDNLYYRYLSVVPEELESEGQSTTGRLHDVLTLAMIAAKRTIHTDRVSFKVDFLMAPGRTETVQVIAHIGPGDTPEPVVTIMLPEDQ